MAAIRAVVGADVAVWPVVKADAYGHGMVPMALALASMAVDGLCVAGLDEAMALRSAGLSVPLLVLYPIPPDGVAAAATAGIAITAGGDRSLLERTLAAAADRPSGATPLLVHLEIDTGLGRGGVAPSDAARVADRIVQGDGVRLEGVWSHIQEEADTPRTAAQLGRFRDVIDAIAAIGALEPAATATDRAAATLHLAATGGILLGIAGLGSAVRPGLSVYGLVPEGLVGLSDLPGESLVAALRPAMSLLARPVRVADLPAGWGISYGPSFTTARPSRIATLPIGYGDGWPRSMSNRAEALVRGVRVPLVGNVAMDAVMADVTDIPGPPVTVDDEFVLIGRQDDARIDAVDVARSRTTNVWEVITSMSARLPRVYHAHAVPVGLRTLTVERYPWPASSSGTATSAISRSTPS